MTQSAFATALLNPDLPPPPGVVGPDGLPDAKRFSVYRNTVNSSLVKVLEAAFPVVQKLVGPSFFAAMALVYLRQNPPKDRRLMLYGAGFAGFLQNFPPVAHLGYLPDVARLEQALRQSYHATDSTPLPATALTTLGEADLLRARLTLAPSVQVLTSNWPIHAIWQHNSHGGPAPLMHAEDVAILRAEFDPTPHLLPPGGAAFLTSLMGGDPLIAALAQTAEGFDLARVLGLLVSHNAIIGVS
ncbi:HvfC/BufC family peptide modification chaperone [Tabrizicola sp.]|uniref:HvfC/BufC family peptide modification chaperone n=1 Tax=Tabrizicola sp. TaxID=2005166 RepID=UPI003D2CAA22